MRRAISLVLSALLLVAIAGLSTSADADSSAGKAKFAPSSVVSDGKNTSTAEPVAPAALPSTNTNGCSDNATNNVRVNQECTNHTELDLLGRGQAQNETAIAVSPTDPNNLIAGQNDYRRGDGVCGFAYSYDGGQTWGDGLLPISFVAPGFTAPRHYWDAGGDPAVAFDADGNAYYACLAFNRGGTSDTDSDASGIFLFTSTDGGASWNMNPTPVAISPGDGSDGVGLHDKEYIAVDKSPASPYQGRVYIAWVKYSLDFTAAVINLAWSDNAGASWHQSGNVFSDSVLCPINFNGAPAGKCNANQFPVPFTAPNGDVYVVSQNFNNNTFYGPGDNHNQILLAKSTDGGSHFGPPVKVADWYDLPDCFTYTGDDAGRACVPTAPLSDRSVFRATNYPSAVAVSTTRVVVDFGSYINQHSNSTKGNCVPTGFSQFGLNTYDGVGVTNGCNNDIVRSISNDGGASFTGTDTNVEKLTVISNEMVGKPLADQWWQWTAFNPATNHVVTSYYDRKYGQSQQNGNMDITMHRGDNSYVRVTNKSIPPSRDFTGASGSSLFLGDYAGLAVGTDGQAHPFWTDTRNAAFAPNPANPLVLSFSHFSADVYTRRLLGL
ncbi:MAG TPA: sialidase family protein [Actinomycetota bacterium]|nr:sialidase family protein [Actinomycetota bacterium]